MRLVFIHCLSNTHNIFFSIITIYISTNLHKTLSKIIQELYKKQGNTKTAPYCFFINNKTKKDYNHVYKNKQADKKEKKR